MRNRSLFRLVMTLVFAAFIAIPQSMLAVEPTGGSEGNTPAPISVPSGDNTDDGTSAGDISADGVSTGDTSTDDSSIGVTSTGDTPNYCDYSQKPATTTWTEWFAEAPEPCLFVTNNQPEVCGVVDFTLTNNLVNFPSAVTHRLFWSEGPYAWNNRNTDFPHTFSEDYNGGSVDIYIAYVTNESDYIKGMGAAGHEIYQYYSAINGGLKFTIDTDCELPAEGFFCDFTNYTGVYSVAHWLASAPEGANTDCIDVGDIDFSVCGQVTIPLETRVIPHGFWIEYVEGTDISVGTPKVAKNGVIAFPKDYNGGSVTVTAYIGGPEQDWVSFADEGNWAYAKGGVEITIDTECTDPVGPPEMPMPSPATCQVALTGQTGFNAYRGEVIDRPKLGEGGEVNADGWGNTWRLYGAVDVDVENAVFTWEATQGFTFGTHDGTVNTPGGGALQGNGYTVAVEGLTFTITPGLVTATVDSMPANSSFSFNVQRIMNEGTNFAYMNSTMVGDLVDCAPAVLELPEITPSVCDDNYLPTPVKVTAPENSKSVTYGEVTSVSGPEGVTFTLNATANHGFTFDGATMPDGWSMVSDSEATFSVTLALADCEKPLIVVSPELPVLVAATCDADNKAVAPTLTVPTTEGVTYSDVTSTPANSVKLSLTATANQGYTFAGADMPAGWTMINSSEALFELVADEATCEETPTTPPTKVPEVTELPSTGVGVESSASMIGLALAAATALAGAGLFVTGRKRQ